MVIKGKMILQSIWMLRYIQLLEYAFPLISYNTPTSNHFFSQFERRPKHKGILWEIYDQCTEVFLHQEMKFGTVRSCQNDQKFPQKLTKLSDHFLPEVKNGGTPEVKRGGTLGVKSGGAGGSKKVNLLLLQEVTSLLREDIFKHCGCSDTQWLLFWSDFAYWYR